ncbi:hypothetical protein AGIG_G18346 [Arapaima gigas]
MRTRGDRRHPAAYRRIALPDCCQCRDLPIKNTAIAVIALTFDLTQRTCRTGQLSTASSEWASGFRDGGTIRHRKHFRSME